ncbi:restriction endonuclease subunit S [candidate division WOR-3 bacterium]|nr:restriction endonuclease subunit S [candidate division WOR-3 bacterium]
MQNLTSVAPIANRKVACFDGEKRYLSTGSLQLNETLDFEIVTYENKPSRANQLVQIGDLIFAKMKATQKTLLITEDLADIIVSTGYFVLEPRKDVLSNKYLFYYLNSKFFLLQKDRFCHGATQKALTKDDLIKIKIVLPPLEKQHKIAFILEKCESTIKKRKEANRFTDEFLKFTFLEMFGDPAKNPKKWDIKRFGDIYSSIRYGTGSPPGYQEKGSPFIRATNIKNGTVISSNMKFISPDDAAHIEKCKVSFGDLIIVRSGVNAGDCALIPQEYDGAYAAYDLIVELPYHSAVFYNHLINSIYGKTVIAPMKRRAGQPHLNAEQIGSLNFINPPSPEQQKFSDLVQKVEKLKEKQHKLEEELDNLFNSLMQKAFRGELCAIT